MGEYEIAKRRITIAKVRENVFPDNNWLNSEKQLE